MRDHEIIELYWARNESAITATAEKYGNYCHTIAYNIDLARHMGYSKASISHATSALRKGGFLVIDKDGCLRMTDKGREIAERIYERHQFFTMQLITAGVDPEIAEYEACLIEHAISQDSFEKIRRAHERER